MADFDAEELGCADADDGEDTAVQAHGAVGNRGILAELGFPEGITDDGAGRTAAGAIVVGGEDSAYSGAGPEDAEEVSANKEAFGVSCLAYGDQVEGVGAPSDDIGKRLLVLADTFPIGRSQRGACSGPPPTSA